MPKGIAQEIQRLQEMLRDLKPRRTGPPRTRPEKGPKPIGRPKKRRPVKPNAPGGSKPARKRVMKKPLKSGALPRS